MRGCYHDINHDIIIVLYSHGQPCEYKEYMAVQPCDRENIGRAAHVEESWMMGVVCTGNEPDNGLIVGPHSRTVIIIVHDVKKIFVTY